MSGGADLPPAYFDALYARDSDPWRFRDSAYEHAKYDDTLRALSRPRYARALEVGCSIGELTARLAPRCDALVATDVAEAALAEARARNAGVAQVAFVRGAFPHEVPAGPFDLILLSEVLYYLAPDTLARAAAAAADRLAPDGEALLVHWLGETPDYPQTGDQAADGFIAAAEALSLSITMRTRRALYRLDRLARRP